MENGKILCKRPKNTTNNYGVEYNKVVEVGIPSINECSIMNMEMKWAGK